ncbi:MAG: hypothetical protein IJP99_10635 [Methanobrevibacter sp.]|nr:hypothetical protein [Methanobrevibacter sp.]MBR0059774.1 hypothetical protein [Methanobrevibacter sp.]
MEITLHLDDEQAKKLMMVTVISDKSVEKYTNDVLINHLNSINSERIINEVEKLFLEPKQISSSKKLRNKGDGTLIIPKQYQKKYIGLNLSRCTILATGQRKTQKLRLDINDALLIKEHGEYTYNEFKELLDKLDITRQILFRFLWNVQEGYVDSLIQEFNSKMDKVYFSVQNKTLYCNSERVCDLIDARTIEKKEQTS